MADDDAFLWDQSWESEWSSFFMLLHAWTFDKEQGWLTTYSLCLDYDLDQITKILLQVRNSLKNGATGQFSVARPSPFKCAAVLVYHTFENKVFSAKYPGRPMALECEALVNAQFAWFMGQSYLADCQVPADHGQMIPVKRFPKFPSKHMWIECCELLLDPKKATPSGLALILEAVTYLTNPKLPRCQDQKAIDEASLVFSRRCHLDCRKRPPRSDPKLPAPGKPGTTAPSPKCARVTG